MINVFRKILDFSGPEQDNIRKSIVVGLLQAVFHAMHLGAIFLVLTALDGGDRGMSAVWGSLGLMLAAIVGQIITRYFSQLQRTHAGYFMAANKRIALGDKLKSVPMGFFNRNSLGSITAIATTVLSEVENMAPVILVTTLGGFLNGIVFAAVILLFDWRIGLIVVAGILVFLWATSLLEHKTRKIAPQRQAPQETLVEAVLEAVQGMSVIKAFHLDDTKSCQVDSAVDESCAKNLALEKTVTPYIAFQQVVLYLFGVGIILASVWLHLSSGMSLPNCLMMVIASFLIFEQLRGAGSGAATLRLCEMSIDRANEVDAVPLMDEGGRAITPVNHEIRFEDVRFAYEQQAVLDGINMTIPDKTMTAIVGPSGSGKTTLCHLIARFWDVNSGKVSIGGVDVRDYTLDSLMSNVSVVFQNVYLFADTIENNIRFGSPGANREEIVEAAKRACCHDSITALPDGYNTFIGEGGASLSGGEKQRISIARALLKDAPIIIFDEATANVDPENEDRLQAAIMADQILVIDDGRIVQRGKHDELIGQAGIYRNFVHGRKEAVGWKLAAGQ